MAQINWTQEKVMKKLNQLVLNSILMMISVVACSHQSKNTLTDSNRVPASDGHNTNASPEFSSKLQKVEGKFFKGTNKSGKTCRVYLKTLVHEEGDSYASLFITLGEVTNAMLKAKTRDEYLKATIPVYPHDFEGRKDKYTTQVGTSENIIGQAKGKNKLVFYGVRFRPQFDVAVVELSEDGNSIKSAKINDVGLWLGIGNFSTKTTKADCKID